MARSTEKGEWLDSFPFVTEQVKVSAKELKIRVNVLSGEQGEHFVHLAPSLDVSGYGRTKEDAKKSFEENMRLFILDFLKLSDTLRRKELNKMGWRQQRIFKRQFSKAFVDKDGVLQNLKNPQIAALDLVE